MWNVESIMDVSVLSLDGTHNRSLHNCYWSVSDQDALFNGVTSSEMLVELLSLRGVLVMID